MSQQLDAKRNTIISILYQLSSYNSQIGSYVSSALTADANYSVQLDNGSIELPGNLVHDHEQAAHTTTDEQYEAAAAQFIPEGQRAPLTAIPHRPQSSTRRYFYAFLVVVLLVIFLLTIIL